jgi:methylmalonyl-CoA/ethylmalonyl-CoA epimerase
MSQHIEHLGVVVDDLGEAKRFMGDVLGFEAGREMDLPERGVRVAFFKCGEMEIELIEVVDHAMRKQRLGSDKARIEHIAIVVDELEPALKRLTDHGVHWTTPDVQYVAQSGATFVMTDPDTCDGVQYQIIKRGKPGPRPA